MSLKSEIQSWDGKNLQTLKRILQENRDSDNWSDELLGCFDSNPSRQAAVTWLLKNDLEQGATLNAKQTSRFISWNEEFEYWEPKLHLLQSLQWMKIPKACKKGLEKFLRDSLEEKNKFVRAWAYNGFHILSLQYPEYADEANQLLNDALESEAASVKARIRQALKKR